MKFHDHIVDLKIPMTIYAASLAEAEQQSAAWIDGLRHGLKPGILLQHAVVFEAFAVSGYAALALRIAADCPASAISRIPEIHERYSAPGVIKLYDWRDSVSVRASQNTFSPRLVAKKPGRNFATTKGAAEMTIPVKA